MGRFLLAALFTTLACALVVFMPWAVHLPTVAGWEALQDPVCDSLFSSRPADVVLESESRGTARPAPVVAFSDLPLHVGETVRFGGYLTIGFEGTAIYPSFQDALQSLREVTQGPPPPGTRPRLQPVRPRLRGLWTDLDPVFFDDKYWRLRGPLLGSRCACVEGRFRIRVWGHMDLYYGALSSVRRLEIWLEPYRPLVPERPQYMEVPAPPMRIKRQIEFTSTPTLIR